MPRTPSLLIAASVLLSCGPADKEESFSVIADQIPGGTLLGVATVGGEALFVGGQLDQGTGVIVHYDGQSLCYEESATDRALWWIHAPTETEFYAVGEAGTILHSVDGQRSDESVETDATFFGVYDTGDYVMAVGGRVRGDNAGGEVWVKEGDTWSMLATDLPGVAFKVWENMIVGDGIAYQVAGGDSLTLEPVFPPNDARLTTVHGRSRTDIYAVGGANSSVFLAWNGSEWSELSVDPRCANMGLNGVWTAPDENVWIAGFFGSMGERSADGAWNCATSPPTFETFHVVAKHGDEVLFGGGNFLDIGGNYGTIGRYGENTTELTAVPCE